MYRDIASESRRLGAVESAPLDLERAANQATRPRNLRSSVAALMFKPKLYGLSVGLSVATKRAAAATG
jgi:hypothetical protein